MNTYNEQRLINEVIFLHGLWRQGPPGSQNPHSSGTAAPLPLPPRPQQQHRIINPHPSLTVSRTTSFKKPERRKGKKKKLLKLEPDSGVEWPSNVAEKKEGPDSRWGKPSCVSEMQDMPAEDREKFKALGMQQKVINICNKFFTKGGDDDDDEEEEEEEEEDEEEGSGDEEDGGDSNRECEEYNFFRSVFIENVRFREYYETNYENGEFCCLVCCRKGKKVFKGCMGLVQHSSTISTKGRRAHRALARIVCEVLGWNYDRLPTIVMTGKPLPLYLVNAGETKVELERNADSDKKELDAGTSTANIVHFDDGESVVRKVDNSHEASAEPHTNATASTADIVSCDNNETVEREESNPDQTCAETVIPSFSVETEEDANYDKKELDAGTSIAKIVHGDNDESVMREVDKPHETSAEPNKMAFASNADVVNCYNSEMVERGVPNPEQTCTETVVPNFKVETKENVDSDKKQLDAGVCTTDLVDDDCAELYG